MIHTPAQENCIKEISEQFHYLFDEEVIEEICKVGERKSIPADEMIIDVGDRVNFLPLILSGTIKIMTEDKQGDELLLYYLEFGDTCAVTINCCTRQSKSSIRAISETAVEMIVIPIEYLDSWMAKHQSWRNFILESYNSRLNEMIDALDNIVFNSLEDRVKKYIKEKVYITRSEDLDITHADIANDLHSSRVVISRIMKKLEKEGYISLGRGKLKYLRL